MLIDGDKWTSFSLTIFAQPSAAWPVADLPAIGKLSSAAGYLSCAHDDLVAAGYDKFGDEVNHLIETLAAEISWLNVARNESESP